MNPLLQTKTEITVDVETLKSKTVFKRERREALREMRDLRRCDNAREAIEDFEKGVELYGLTKGLFSLTDIIVALLEKTGPAELFISTRTAAKSNVAKMIELINSGKVVASWWLVDFSFHRRSPELSMEIRGVFGDNAVRIAKNHSKFTLIRNSDWDIVVRTSMNLNQNPRLENFTIAHDPELSTFLRDILAEIWKTQDKDLAFKTWKEMCAKI